MTDFKSMAQAVKEDIIRWRHDFHEHPELSFKEVETTQKVAAILREIGYEQIQTGIPRVPEIGVVADLNPGKPGRCIALRADMDALPVSEETGLPYASKNKNIMHACGHDAHIAMLLGAAKVLFQLRDQINGNVRLIFQPSEEYVLSEECRKSGARLIVEEGSAMGGVDAIFALHVWGTLPTGVICYTPGPFMTTNLIVDMKVKGVGGHGAMPQDCIDPVIAACQIISAWQTIISREVAPQDTAVLSVGGINVEGTAYNIIPESVSVLAGVRTYSEELIGQIESRMKEIAEGIAHAMRAEISFSTLRGVPPVINDEEFTENAVRAICQAVGPEHMQRIKPVMPSEDFSWYQKLAPGAIMFLGVGDETKGTNYAQHHPKFNSDDDALPVGVAGLAAVAYHFLAGETENNGGESR